MSDPAQFDWRQSNVLVTGASGFLGAALVKGLVARGSSVHATVNKDSYTDIPFAFNTSEVTAVTCDVADLNELHRLFANKSFDVIFHLAASNNNTELISPYALWETNIRGTYSILEACRIYTPNARIVIASSREAEFCFGSSSNRRYHPYMVSKAADELIAFSYRDSYSLSVACVRTDNIYGEGDRNWHRLIPSAILSILKGDSPVIRSDGKMTRSYVYVGDVVNAYCAVAERLPNMSLSANPLKISTGKSISVQDLVTLLISISGQKELHPRILHENRDERIDQIYDSALEKEMLDWECATTFHEGLTRTYEWYKAHVGILPA
ncbi:NAD(P)-dependent oxidoreductase [Synechococcus sp. MIT S9508]|uniref:NAD-dependent epimerase/dehydratase family protein n=1 Tax=Synechococcus sp. MIT S9508 TaxID=1801629 RepID=UPI0007BB29E3|nr:NAD(P)-dependent oxidoreductase [Synechococcus sp. MIT S9508]KZR90572.1 dTDP-4-oxo-6-deoxy-D-allose reductase [Synechococcus sp. MIT S9508]